MRTLRARFALLLMAALMLGTAFSHSSLLLRSASAAPANVSAANTVLAWTADVTGSAAVTLDGSASSEDITEYAWWLDCPATPCDESLRLTPNGDPASTEVVTVPLTVGTYNVYLWAQTGSGDWTASAPITVTVAEFVPPAPVANAGADQTVPATGPTGASVNLDGSGSTGATGYSWAEGATVLATTATAAVTLAAGPHTIVLTVTGPGGTDTDDVLITVTEAPAAPVADAGPDQTVGSTGGDTAQVTLDGTASTDATAYSWAEGATVLATTATAAVTLAAGTHTIVLTVTGPGGTDTDEVVISVINANAGPDQTAFLTNGTTAPVDFDGSASVGAVSFSWAIQGQPTPLTGETPQTLLPLGQHRVTLTITGAGEVTDTDEMFVVVLPQPPLEANAGIDQTVEATNGSTADVTLNASGSASAVSYVWNLPEPLPDATGEQPVVTLPIGVNTIVLTATSASGATDTDSVVITVTKPPAKATVTPVRGTVGTTFDYTIIGFPNNAVTTIFLLGAGGVSVNLGNVTTNGVGVATGTLTVPSAPGGAKEIRFSAGAEVENAAFEIAPRIVVTPGTVERGQTVVVNLTGMGKSVVTSVRWLVNGAFVQVATLTTGANGSGQVNVVVPAGAAAGTNSVRADGGGFGAQTSAVTVVIPPPAAAVLVPVEGIVGTSVAYTLSNFPASATVNIAFERTSGSTVSLGTVTTDATGGATGNVTIPATPGGNSTLRFTAGTKSAEAGFKVLPRIRVSPGTAAAGDVVGVSLRGYAQNEVVNVSWKIGTVFVQVGQATTSNTGSANLNVTVPAGAALGENTVRGAGPIFSAETTVTVEAAEGQPTADLEPTRGTVNTTVAYTLTNFPVSATVDITWRRTSGSLITIGTATTDVAGAASGSFLVPATAGGASQQVRFFSGTVSVTVLYEIAPRIKVLNAGAPGDDVEVSLRGYGQGETVRIRWLVDGVYIQVGTAVTSNSGSANVTVAIPEDAAPGNNSVRGDGTTFRAQTNVAVVTEPAP